jgi:hypothetical protein
VRFQHEVDITNRTKLVGIVSRTVIDDGEFKLSLGRVILVSPFLEMVGELGVGDHVNPVDARDRREIIEHVLDHGLSRDRQQRFGLGQSQGIKSRGVTGGENNDFHGFRLLDFSSVLKDK